MREATYGFRSPSTLLHLSLDPQSRRSLMKHIIETLDEEDSVEANGPVCNWLKRKVRSNYVYMPKIGSIRYSTSTDGIIVTCIQAFTSLRLLVSGGRSLNKRYILKESNQKQPNTERRNEHY